MTLHWQGDVDNNWSTPGNWLENQIPLDGDSLVFDTAASGFTGVSSNNDLTNLAVESLLIAKEDGPTSFTLTGNAISLQGGLITSGTTGSVEVNLAAITLDASQAFDAGIRTNYQSDVAFGNNDLEISGRTQWFRGSIGGDGDVTVTTGVNFLANNSYSGLTHVIGGSIRLAGAGTLGDTHGGSIIEDGTLETLSQCGEQ